jgi:hypothetical protein
LHDIAFDENNFWNWENNVQEEQAGDLFIVEYLVTVPREEATDAPGEAAAPAMPIAELGSQPIVQAPVSATALVVFTTPPTTDRDHDVDEGGLTEVPQARRLDGERQCSYHGQC